MHRLFQRLTGTALLTVVVLFFTSCGKQHQAEQVATAFIDQYYMADKYDATFSSLDSTIHVSDSALVAMRGATAQSPLFKRGIKYADIPNASPLYYVRASIIHDNDTVQSTFYMDKTLENIVAVKSVKLSK